MAQLGAGPVSGYRSHGPERRADAGHASPASLGGAAMVRVPFRDVTPLGDPQPLRVRAEVRGVARAVQSGRRARSVREQRTVDQIIRERQKPSGWTATAVPAGPAYGGAAWNGGGGDLASAMSGSSQPRGIAGPPRPGPGVRVTSKPPTSQARSRAGRDRRADNFKAKRSGPPVIQGTAEEVTPEQPSGGKQGNRGWKLQAEGNRNRGRGGREGPGPTGMYP